MPIWAVSLIPLMALVIGAIAATVRAPGAILTSSVQHFAAGLVFAAAASEILPDLKHQGAAIPVVVGGTIGVLIMLGVKKVGERTKGTFGLVAITSVDIFVDGLVLGTGFAAGAKQGTILTIALTIEILFLGLSMALKLKQAHITRTRIVVMTAGAGLLLPLGILAGQPVSLLAGPYLTAIFAFSLIALLYLVVEELLVEAHAEPENPLVTTLFFAGFLLLLVLEETVV